MRNYWLVKSEPGTYGFDDLIKEKKTMWDGVRNYGARNNMRAMKEGDFVFFYHSIKGLEIVGICEVVKEAYPDPTATKGDWSVVDVVPVKRMTEPVSLATIKATPELQELAIIKNSRLSVMPIPEAEFKHILKMGKTEIGY